MSIKSRIFLAGVGIAAFPMKCLIRLCPKMVSMIMSAFCIDVQPEDYYLDYRVSPKRPTSIPLFEYSDDSLKDLGIILQGPFREKDGYTVETIRYYRKLYPQATVILSTWAGLDLRIRSELEGMGVVVIESRDISNPGVVNTNRQKHTTLAGIRKAEELGLKYAAKTRTDQCLRRPHVFQFMLNLLKEFPAGGSCQDERIIVLPTMCAGDVFYPYCFGDCFFMGTVKDLEAFWDVPDDDNPERPIMGSKRLQSRMSNESSIIRGSFPKLRAMMDYSVREHWEILKKYFICLDNGIVNLHYAKDDWQHSYSKSVNVMQSEYADGDNGIILKTENFGFVNWLNLMYGSMEYDEKLEKYADSPLW